MVRTRAGIAWAAVAAALCLWAGTTVAQEVLPETRPAPGAAAEEGPGGRGGAGHAGAAGRAGARGGPATAEAPAEKVSVTLGTLHTAAGEDLGYTASAGYLPMVDEQGKPRANIFYTSYVIPQTAATQPATEAASSQAAATQPIPPETPRPVTFLFNGGPGAASVWLHLGAVGPKRLDLPPDGSPPSAPYKLVNNAYSWLPASDLVFIDPVNTGFSRAAEPADAKQFFGVSEDVNAVGEFIRLWLTKNKRWDSPIFIAGESYGTTRAAALAEHLQERVGVEVSGVILMSTVLNFATLDPSESNDLGFALYLPSYAAVAFYHHKLGNTYPNLDAVLKDAEQFTLNEYMAALAKGAALPADQRQAVATKIAALTGLPVGYVLQSNLRIPPQRFEKELLRGSGDTLGQIIGRFDGRLTGAPTDPVNDSVTYDPSLSGFYPAYTSAFNTYVRDTLKFDSELPYEVLSSRTQPWNWGGNGVSGYLYVGDNLRNAMTQNPRLRLMVCQGRFDLATPYFATDYTVNHLGLAPSLRKNITQKYYPGGHMLYHVREGLEQLSKDAQGFIKGAE